MNRGGARIFPMDGPTLSTGRLKYGFQGTINAKNLRKIGLSPSNGGTIALWPSPAPLLFMNDVS